MSRRSEQTKVLRRKVNRRKVCRRNASRRKGAGLVRK